MSNIDGPQYVRRENYVDPPTPAVPQAAIVTEQRLVPGPADRTEVVQQAPVVAVTQVRTTAPAGNVRTAYSRRFAPDAVIAALVGLFLLIVGLLAVVRGGFDGSMDVPVVEVLGFTHTTTLGLIEAGLGLCLLISGATSSRSGALLFASVMGIAGFVGAVQTKSFAKSLALESGHAWLLVVAAIAVVASALLMPRFVTHSTTDHPVP